MRSVETPVASRSRSVSVASTPRSTSPLRASHYRAPSWSKARATAPSPGIAKPNSSPRVTSSLSSSSPRAISLSTSGTAHGRSDTTPSVAGVSLRPSPSQLVSEPIPSRLSSPSTESATRWCSPTMLPRVRLASRDRLCTTRRIDMLVVSSSYLHHWLMAQAPRR